METRVLSKLNNGAIALIFCIALFGSFFIGALEKYKGVSEKQQEEASNVPEIPESEGDTKNLFKAYYQEIKGFLKPLNAYYSKSSGLKIQLVEYYRSIKYFLGDSPSITVTVGEDGWLFLGSVKSGADYGMDPVGDYLGANLYSQKDLKRVGDYMTNLKSWLNAKGIEYLFVVAPNKHTIYSDKLPGYLSKVSEETATDQLYNYLKQHTSVSTVDLRSKLISEKKNRQLYHKTDTHWNYYGANIAQYEIISAIEKMFPGQIQPEMADIKIGLTPANKDLERYMGLSLTPPTGNYPLSPVYEGACTPIIEPPGATLYDTHAQICEGQKLNAVVFRDSFFFQLEPFFITKFKRSTYLWKDMDYPTLIKYIELEKPDIIIEEISERKLPYIPKSIEEYEQGNFH